MTIDTEIRSFFEIPIQHFPDRSARWLLQDKENVQGLLEIVASEFVHRIDFSRLSFLNRSFIAGNLREQEADILFSVPFQGGSESDELLIYILIEHQSTVDVAMGFRLLSYMMQIWEAQRHEWDSSGLPKSQWRLRPILPIVFYSGDRRWNTPLTLDAIMDIPDVLSQFVPKFDVLFLNVKETDTADLTKTDHPFGWLLTVLQQESSNKELIMDALVKAVSHLNTLGSAQSEQRYRAIRYLLLLILHRRPVEEHQDLIKLVDQHTHEMEVEAMAKSMADVLIEQGKAEGIEQGKAEGIEQGKAEGIEQGKAEGIEQGKVEGIEQGKVEGIEQGKVEGIEQGETRAKQAAVLKLIQFRFDDIPESITNQIVSIQDLSRLDSLFEEVWDADLLDEIDFRNRNN